MSRWFQEQRQAFIADRLATVGQLQRADLMQKFDIGAVAATRDIKRFIDRPTVPIRYDRSARRYVRAG